LRPAAVEPELLTGILTGACPAAEVSLLSSSESTVRRDEPGDEWNTHRFATPVCRISLKVKVRSQIAARPLILGSAETAVSGAEAGRFDSGLESAS
jgi:hypothetical protein